MKTRNYILIFLILSLNSCKKETISNSEFETPSILIGEYKVTSYDQSCCYEYMTYDPNAPYGPNNPTTYIGNSTDTFEHTIQIAALPGTDSLIINRLKTKRFSASVPFDKNLMDLNYDGGSLYYRERLSGNISLKDSVLWIDFSWKYDVTYGQPTVDDNLTGNVRVRGVRIK